MKIFLRPHHFLCLQGYKGLNYSKNQAQLWENISKILKDNPDIDIFILNGKDDLCENCPTKFLKNKARCLENTVNGLDEKVVDFLKISKGEHYKYSEILNKLQIMTEKKHEEFCSMCSWWLKGLCRDSFKNR